MKYTTKNSFVNYSKRIEDLKNILNIQGQKGNWDIDDYMCGFYNGLELARAIMEDSPPKYKKLKKR